MKKGIVVFLAMLLTVGAGVLLPLLTQQDKDGATKGTAGNSTPGIITPVAVIDTVVTHNSDIATPLATPTSKYKSDVILRTPSPTNKSQNVEVTQEGKATPKPTLSEGDKKEPTPKATKNAESVSWVERKIKEHRDEIDDEDLADFRRIYSSVNIAYIQGLMDEGLDDEGMTELKSYLRNTLGGDYERAKELFYRYSYLLSEV
ncbi:MAG: hypothetical protein GX270_00915 [Clostridiaceae bacterium]|nr:hypothetical protein [Clostridiaceae bacterium]